ncbi:MAG: 50S ribosomal protein L15 [Candidatus Moranbacteria bacterium]|nr:50S ribosomal protein L15 [Candidatus Moranbacteria bacterium]
MQIHQLKSKIQSKKKKRIGRGGKRGTYSGKGIKGQRSRSGSGGKGLSEKGRNSWVKRFPKLGGFQSVKPDNIIVKTSVLNQKFKSDETVSPESLLKKSIISKPKRKHTGAVQQVKILFDQDLAKKLIIKNCLLSKSASNSVKKAGGQLTQEPASKKPLPRSKKTS